jgi:molecular chaperone DnaJ
MLSRAECFKVLGLDESGGPNAIKKAYRRLAFELHPDLHPDLPDASQNFQRLNEAYVLLMQEYANTSFAAGGGTASSRQRPSQSERRASAEYGAATDEKIRTDAYKAYEKAQKATGSSSAWGDGAHKPGFAGDTRDEAKQEAEPGATGAKPAAGQTGEGNARQGHAHRAPSREEILRDLLNDPFARRVFEDIYSHVRYNSGKGAKNAGNIPPPPPKKASRKVQATPLYNKSPLLAVGKKFYGLAGGIKDWLRKQIDEEQNMFLPGESLLPGARIRLQVRHGFSGTKKTVEFTLPPEFAPGKPIRLKGLGRHIGGLQGDLYLRVFNEESADAGENPEE